MTSNIGIVQDANRGFQFCALFASLFALLIASVLLPSSAFASVAQRDVYYTYDAQGHQLTAKFDSATGADRITNVYDDFGDLKSTTINMGGFSKTLSFGYDREGNRISLTHPDSSVFTYTYDGLNRLTGIYEGAGTTTPIDQFVYNNESQLASRTEPQGSSVQYGWDKLGRLISGAHAFASLGGDVTFTLGYNPASQIRTETRTNDSYAWTGSIATDRNYATNGLNQYTATSPANSPSDVTSFTYDANGNLTSDGTVTFNYDTENRLVSTSAGAALTYDPMGRLWRVVKGTSDTRFLYDGDALVAEYDSAGAMTARYVHGSNAEADDPLVWYRGATLTDKRWLHANHQGSIVAVTVGGVPSINTYDEYGLPAANPITGFNINTGRFQYTGQAWIDEVGLYYYKARFYSPRLGRFFQTDPIGYDGGINLYAYVGDDPINRTDPSGLKCSGDQTVCDSDNFQPGKGTVNVSHDPRVDAAVYASRGDYQRDVKGYEPTGTVKADKDGFKVVATSSIGKETNSASTAKFNLGDGVAGVHGHLEGSVVDVPSANKYFGDTESLKQGKPMYTVEGDRVGVHDAPGGHLRFQMTNGRMTSSEMKQIQKNLNTEQKLFLKKDELDQ